MSLFFGTETKTIQTPLFLVYVRIKDHLLGKAPLKPQKPSENTQAQKYTTLSPKITRTLRITGKFTI